MKKQKFAILDAEETYACNLMDYLSDHQSVPFETLAFGSVEALGAYARHTAIDLLLVSAKMMCDEIRRMNIRKIMVLSDGEVVGECSGYPSVYKYQSSESLVAEVMSCYARQDHAQPFYAAKRDAKVIGIYSPIGRCGKTSFAIALCQILAKTRRVLYINLEDFAGFHGLFEQEPSCDLTDVMYFLRQKRGNVVMKLNSALQRIGNVDCIAPAFSPQDIREIHPEEWVRLLQDLVAYSTYQVLVLDIGQTPEDVLTLLASCSRIYMPICTDMVSEAKIEQYERLLREQEETDILEKTRKLQLPVFTPAVRGEYLASRLAEGEMGAFVRALLAKEMEYGAGPRRI